MICVESSLGVEAAGVCQFGAEFEAEFMPCGLDRAEGGGALLRGEVGTCLGWKALQMKSEGLVLDVGRCTV